MAVGHRMTQRFDSNTFSQTYQWFSKTCQIRDSFEMGNCLLPRSSRVFIIWNSTSSLVRPGWILVEQAYCKTQPKSLRELLFNACHHFLDRSEVTILSAAEKGAGEIYVALVNTTLAFWQTRSMNFAWAYFWIRLCGSHSSYDSRESPCSNLIEVYIQSEALFFSENGWRNKNMHWSSISELLAPLSFRNWTLQDGPSAAWEYPMVESISIREQRTMRLPISGGRCCLGLETAMAGMDEGF